MDADNFVPNEVAAGRVMRTLLTLDQRLLSLRYRRM